MDREPKVGRLYRYYTGAVVRVDKIQDNQVYYKNLNDFTNWSEPIEEFMAPLNKKDASWSGHEYYFEQADIIHRNNNKEKLEQAIRDNDGYCPCAVNKSEDTICPCKDFRTMMKDGECHCGLYHKHFID